MTETSDEKKKELLLGMPEVGDDEDFARDRSERGMPREVDLDGEGPYESRPPITPARTEELLLELGFLDLFRLVSALANRIDGAITAKSDRVTVSIKARKAPAKAKRVPTKTRRE